MGDRPHVILSCAMSLDGYIDDRGAERLILSSAEDFDRVDAVRADSDAVLVGAGTVRRDDPRLRIRSERRRAARVAAGRPPHPVRVTLTQRGDLDPAARIFRTEHAPTLVYAADPVAPGLAARLADAPGTEVVAAGDPVGLDRVLTDLCRRGIARLMVEGGGHVHTRFLAAGLADELHLVVAPFLVGQAGAPRFVHPADFPQTPAAPMRLAEARPMGDLVLLRYLAGP